MQRQGLSIARRRNGKAIIKPTPFQGLAQEDNRGESQAEYNLRQSSNIVKCILPDSLTVPSDVF